MQVLSGSVLSPSTYFASRARKPIMASWQCSFVCLWQLSFILALAWAESGGPTSNVCRTFHVGHPGSRQVDEPVAVLLINLAGERQFCYNQGETYNGKAAGCAVIFQLLCVCIFIAACLLLIIVNSYQLVQCMKVNNVLYLQ